MSKISAPLLYSITIESEFPDGPFGHGKAPAPQSWLQQIVDQSDYILANWQAWEKEWGDKLAASTSGHCSYARDCALEAIAALSAGDTNTAMATAFRAGRAIENALKASPVLAGLKYMDSRKTQSKIAGGKGGEKKKLGKKANKDYIRYIHKNELSAEQLDTGITVDDWIAHLRRITKNKVSVIDKTMKTYLTELSIDWKGKRK